MKNRTEAGVMGIAAVSHAVFALVLIGLGILGLIKGDSAAGWSPVPESMPARQVLAYLCDIIYLACGVGLLLRTAAAFAGRVLFGYLLLWLLLLRLPWMAVAFQVGTWWPACSTAVITGAAWVLYSWVAGVWDRQRAGFIIGETGLRIARTLFGMGLIPIGLAHFLYLDATAPLVPAWMQWPVFWSYFTGGAFVVAGIAVIIGVFPRLAAALTAVQIAMLTLVVWIPGVVAGNLNAFQWNEFLVSILLTACGWVVADSYRDRPWLFVSLWSRAGGNATNHNL